MKCKFEIEFPDEFGADWMNVDNLMRCLTTSNYIGEKVSLKVYDVSDHRLLLKPQVAKRTCLLGGHDC